MIFKKKNGHEIDHGITLKTKCPHCRDPSCFRLIEIVSNNLLIVMLQIGKRWILKCSRCKYSLDVEKYEIKGILELNEKAQDFEKGKISKEDFRSLLFDSRLEYIAQLIDNSQIYNCKSCDEEVPLSFENCWNCGHRNDNIVANESNSQPTIPCISDPIFGAMNLIEVNRNPKNIEQRD